MPYYGDGAPYYYGGGGPFSNHSSLMTGIGRSYHSPIAARYSPHLSTISESPLIVLRRYSPAASTTTTTTTSIARPRRIIDTADIDVSKPPRSLASEGRQQRHRLRRDRPTIKIRSQALKDNPALREYNERHEKTVGELLVEKFLIKDKQDDDHKMKMYHQASLMSNDLSKDPTAKEHENEILSAIRRRVTRRMTRRRSSADVVPFDAEQIEREAAFHAAQAEALDTLVAEEQAEIEVEVRRGTFAKRRAMKLPLDVSELSGTEDDEMDDEDRKEDKKKHTTTKKKKRKKLTEKPLPVKSDVEDEDELEIPESVIEEDEDEEEFEWDDREKCDDIRTIAPLNEDITDIKDDARTVKSDANLDINKSKVVKPSEKTIKEDDKVPKITTLNSDMKTDKVKVKETNKEETLTHKDKKVAEVKNKVKNWRLDKDDVALTPAINKEAKVVTKEKQVADAKDKNEKLRLAKDDKVAKKTAIRPKIEDKRVRELREASSTTELNRLKRTKSSPQNEVENTDENFSRFRVEACNSVGDFSTLYVKAANTPSEQPIKPNKTIEQFRESIRLPAPKRVGAPGITTTIETEVVLPVRKPYVRDTSRNSVYLALKPSQNIRQRLVGANDRPSIIIDETRKESGISEGGDVVSSDSRLAKPTVIAEDRSKLECESIISEEKSGLSISDEAALRSASIEKSANQELNLAENKPEVVVQLEDKRTKSRAARHKEEFVSWWDDIEETPEEEAEKPSTKATSTDTSIKFSEKVVENIKSEVLADTKNKIAAVPVVEKVQSKVEVSPKEDLGKIKEDKIKNKVEVPTKEPLGKFKEEKPVSKVEVPPKEDLEKKATKISDKPKTTVNVLDKSVKKVIGEVKENPTDKIVESKVRIPKSVLVKEVQVEEKIKQSDAQKKSQPLPKVSSESEREISTIVARDTTAQKIPLSTNKDESSLSPVKNRTSPEKKEMNNDLSKLKCELPKVDYHHLPNIPEEPKSTSPTEKKPLFTNKSKTNETSNNKALSTKEESNFSVVQKKTEQPLIKPNLAPAFTAAKKEKDERKKKVDAEAIMKIEKKILEDAESPDKILTTAIPEPAQIIERAALAPSAKKEEEDKLSSPSPVKKVGLIPTKKKSSETIAAAHSPEIDFWSEIKPEESEKASGTPRKVQSRVDSPSVEQPVIVEDSESSSKIPEKLSLDLSKINAVEVPDDLKTPLVPEQEELKTPLILDPLSPLAENLSEVPPANLEHTEDRSATVVYNDVKSKADQQDQEQQLDQEPPPTPTNDSELSGTVKKISKWNNHDNLSNLNEADADATPITSKEVSPVISAQSSTTTKKKVVKRKKSATTGKKKSEKGESTKKPSAKKAPAKKVAASPQTSLLKTPMSATGSPRNTPSQRPADLMKLFYTTPTILLTATPRDLRKVRRAKVKRKKPPTRTPSLSSDSTGSTRSTATTSTEEGSNCEEDAEQKRLASTRSNDSGFDGSPRLSTPSQSSENQRNAETEHFHHSGRITPPATNLPRFKKYEVTDFNFLKVLGKGSFGKVLLAELRGTEYVYAVKCLKKDVVLEDDDVECTLIERKVLTLATRHPYLCHLFCTFQTESHLFFVMEYLNGGDLMFHIQKSGRFSEARAKFYAAEIWSGLIFLHKKGIVYRDLKLDNVLLDFEGHIRIADFGMCKLQIFLDRTADTFCGTPDYMAPEIIKGLKYNQAVDWWSFGVLLYEMLTGQSPFSGCDEDELFWSICNERPFIPRYLSQSSTDILVCLLEKDAGKRIPGHEIACHPFFCTISWEKLERRTLEPPFKPAVEHTLDTRYFDTAFTTERPRLTPVPEQILTSMDQAVFRGFSYTNPNATD